MVLCVGPTPAPQRSLTCGTKSAGRLAGLYRGSRYELLNEPWLGRMLCSS